MSITNTSGLPNVIYNAARQKTYGGEGKKGYSVTELLRSPTEIVLKNRHKEETTRDVKDMAATMIGTAVHNLLELGNTPTAMYDIMTMFKDMLWEMFLGNDEYDNSFKELIQNFYKKIRETDLLETLKKEKAENGNVILENRFETDIDGVNLSGGVDYLNLDTKTIMDYKNTSVMSLIGKKSQDTINKYTLQLNLYRYMIYKSKGIDIDTLSILFIFKDWSYKTYIEKYMKEGNASGYPTSSIYELPISVLPFDVIEEYIKEKISKIRLYEAIEDIDIPPCDPEDRWLDPPTFTLKKKTNTRNTKVSQYYKDVVKEKDNIIEKEIEKATKKMKEITPMMLEEIREQITEKVNNEYEINKIEHKSTKCNRFYCDAYQFCTFGKNENPENNNSETPSSVYDDLEFD